MAQQLARGRLGQYAERLHAFLERQPSAEEVLAWLVEGELTDAGVWARGDSRGVRREARRDFSSSAATQRWVHRLFVFLLGAGATKKAGGGG